MSRTYIPQHLRVETETYFQGRCAYCRSPERLMRVFYEVDHILPVARGGQTISDNLAYACPMCNRYKAVLVRGKDPLTERTTALFHPRRQNWFRHFTWSADALHIVGRTVCGRATVETLRLNQERLTELRRLWRELGATPPNWER